jgi:Flp pilus assembly protein TadG
MGPSKWSQRLRQRQRDEDGAELVEFAIVVVVLITLLYGVISYALVFLTQTAAAQAANDASRAALATYNYDISIGDTTAAAETAATATAQSTVNNDLGWLRKPSTTCSASAPTSSTPVECATSYPTGSTCGSTACLSITVAYDYAGDPLVPELALGVAMPSTLTSTVEVVLPTG